jgi:hypothetical protein
MRPRWSNLNSLLRFRLRRHKALQRHRPQWRVQRQRAHRRQFVLRRRMSHRGQPAQSKPPPELPQVLAAVRALGNLLLPHPHDRRNLKQKRIILLLRKATKRMLRTAVTLRHLKQSPLWSYERGTPDLHLHRRVRSQSGRVHLQSAA